jgi:maltose alpha-D-glucosyltransferase/alpha-amylase
MSFMSLKWFKNAVMYAVEVDTFQDSNGDGIGDFRGLIERLDYLEGLGVNCLWLLPFYPSPRRDNGYDVTNYYGIDPRYGTLDDFRDLILEAKERGIRVMIDLVVHHTSDRHPWFEAARSDRNSMYRDYYIWSDRVPAVPTERSFFPEVESGVWRYDNISKSYYRHGFYHFQPDLNFANPRVREEVFNIVDFWLSLGVSCFRIDAAMHIMGRKGLPATEVDDPGAFWKKLREYMDRRLPGAVLLAEADVDIPDIKNYVLDGQGVHMILNFWTNQTMVYALASSDSQPLMSTLGELPVMPKEAQYVNFLRNLDELNLERLTDDEQKAVYQAFGYNKHMQIYARGIRRRLAPMLRHADRLRMAFSLLFAMPGTPLIVYGDELGFGDNLALDERNSVRTPMQWSSGRNGGFSSAESSEIIERTITSPHYHYTDVNVTDQAEDPDSLLNFIKRLIKLRLSHPIIGVERFKPIPVGEPHIVAFTYKDGEGKLFTFHNLSSSECAVKLNNPRALAGFKEIWQDHAYDRPKNGNLALAGYGWRWFHRG